MTILEELTEYANNCLHDIQVSEYEDYISCHKHKYACQRFLRDVERAKANDAPFVWDEKEAQSIVDWFGYLRHSKGELAGHSIELTPWQKFCLCQIYGWRRQNGRRRFKKSFIEVARKNAKSQMESGIALYEISVTSRKNSECNEVYTAGVKRDQSKIVFDEAARMLNGSPLFRKFKCKRDAIEYAPTGSFIKPLSRDDGKGGDGSNPALLVLDEYHQHKDTDFYDLGLGGNTKEPLLMIITTAGKDLTYPCYTQEYAFVSKLLDPGSDVDDDEYFADVLELDPEDYANFNNLDNERLWRKANPIRMSYPEGVQKIRGEYKLAKEIPEKMTAFLTKMMDIWVHRRRDGYMNMEQWKACEVSELPIDIKGLPVYVGFDMSAKNDLTSVSFVIPYLDGGQRKYIIFCHSFVPTEEKLIEHVRVDHAAYDAWERAGYVTITNSPIVDQKAVMDYALGFCARYELHIEMLCFDPANASLMMMELSDEGYNVVEVYQSHKSLNEATQGFREQVLSGNIVYLPNPVLNFAMSNTVVRKMNGLIKIDKDAARQRIDPVDAVLAAYKLAMYHQLSSSYEDVIDEFLDIF